MSKITKWNEMFLAQYQNGTTQPTNPANVFGGATLMNSSNAPQEPSKLAAQVLAARPMELSETQCQARIESLGYPLFEIIGAMYPDGVRVNSRHNTAVSLATDLYVVFDGNEQLVKYFLLTLPFVQEVVRERGGHEIEDVVEWAKKKFTERETKNIFPKPSREMRNAFKQVTGQTYESITKNPKTNSKGMRLVLGDDIVPTLELMGKKIKRFFPHFPLLELMCHGLLVKHYAAALFVGSGFSMDLMTRTWYKFYGSPGQKCRLNHFLEIIGRQGSGKHFAVDLYNILGLWVKLQDKISRDASI